MLSSDAVRERLRSLLAIGDRATDGDRVRLQHHFLVAMALLMSAGALLWAAICLGHGLLWQSLIPFGYVAATAINLAWFRTSKRFGSVRFFQVLISLLLPFVFQWSIGGFVSSGGVMLWALLALVGGFTFQDIALNFRWLIVYIR